jgi:putative transposase
MPLDQWARLGDIAAPCAPLPLGVAFGTPKACGEKNAGGLVYHVLNRASARLSIFETDEDYAAFERVLEEAVMRVDMRLLAYCVIPNHWHLVVWPRADGDLSKFVGWLTLTHTQGWHAHRRSVGCGHLYQGRFKSFLVEEDEHFLTVCRYAERNSLRAGLCPRAEDWRWSSLCRWVSGDAEAGRILSAWPVERPQDWMRWVNRPQTEAELERLRRSARRGQPFGSDAWTEQMVERFGLESTLRPPGRPRTRRQKNGS